MPYVNRRLNTNQLHIKAIDRQLSPLRILRAVHSVRDARSVLALSQSDLGREIGRLLNVQPLSQSTVANAEAGTIRLQREYLDAIGRRLATWLAQTLGRDDVAIALRVNSPWRVTPMARCATCGAWYELKRVKQFTCAKHGRR